MCLILPIGRPPLSPQYKTGPQVQACGTAVAYGAIGLRARYGMPGTDTGYGATGSVRGKKAPHPLLSVALPMQVAALPASFLHPPPSTWG
eukprot:350533-Rhodomonas_salina.2